MGAWGFFTKKLQYTNEVTDICIHCSTWRTQQDIYPGYHYFDNIYLF
jgi:hypothetical protein